MRIFLLAVLFVLLGIALGIGVAALRIRAAPPRLETISTSEIEVSDTRRPVPRAVVERPEYDFGSLDIAARGMHEFVVWNVGDAPLELRAGETSCACILGEIPDKAVAPGDAAKVTVRFKPAKKPGAYRQTADVLTNDLTQPRITLAVTGHITVASRFVPSELIFSRIASTETGTAQSRLFWYGEKPAKIVEERWADAASSRHFAVAWSPLGAEAIQAEPGARGGWLATVTVKPGLALGAFTQELLVENENWPATRALPIRGTIGGDIVVMGRGWDAETGILTLGQVPRSTGATRRLFLVIRGASNADTAFRIASVAPKTLQARLGERQGMSRDWVARIPLEIEVPANSPSGNYLGSRQGARGEIVLEMTHARASQLTIFVSYAIEG
jgi:hypothetical protein